MRHKKSLPTTVYLDPKLARAAKVKAALTDKSLSEIVSEAVARYLSEDALDLEAFHQRADEPTRSFEAVLKDLKKDGLI